MTDGMFITSRDRKLFSVWPESFVRPGLRTRDSWFYGDTYQNWGLVETKSAIEDAPPELSLYVTERTVQETGAVLRRYSLRIDGFVSLHAPLVGGELLTKPITFAGNQLSPERLDVRRRLGADRDPEHRTARRYPASRWPIATKCTATIWSVPWRGRGIPISAPSPASRCGCGSK